MSLTLVRKIAGFSMTELARRAGVDLSAIYRFETEPHIRRLSRAEYATVAKIAAAVNLTPDELVTLAEATAVHVRRQHPDRPAAAAR
jgi:transcriptional regulator with XRE-family HTH domain